jgi:hypothetical protein
LARWLLLLPFRPWPWGPGLIYRPRVARAACQHSTRRPSHLLRLHSASMCMHCTRWICVLTPSPSHAVTHPSPCSPGVLVTKPFCMWHLGGSIPLISHRLPCFQNSRWRRCPRCVSDYAATALGMVTSNKDRTNNGCTLCKGLRDYRGVFSSRKNLLHNGEGAISQ